MGVEQLAHARAPPNGFVRNAGGSGRRRSPESGVGATGRDGDAGVGRRIGFSLTVDRSGRPTPPFLFLGPAGRACRWRVRFI